MGLLKDWREDNEGIRFRYKIIQLFSPKEWFRLHKWRKQRADRGWSDRDTWGAGEYIVQITAEMLQRLNDNAYTDWPEWFKLYVKEEKSGSYNDLQSVIDDMNQYIEFSKGSWADGLDRASDNIDDWIEYDKDGNVLFKSPGWFDKTTGKKLTEKQITAFIDRHCKQETASFKKASKAMQFFGRHFWVFWD